jgi:hypothetical protein
MHTPVKIGNPNRTSNSRLTAMSAPMEVYIRKGQLERTPCISNRANLGNFQPSRTFACWLLCQSGRRFYLVGRALRPPASSECRYHQATGFIGRNLVQFRKEKYHG